MNEEQVKPVESASDVESKRCNEFCVPERCSILLSLDDLDQFGQVQADGAYVGDLPLSTGALRLVQDLDHASQHVATESYSAFSNMIWEAAIIFAKWMDAARPIPPGATVVELGAGMGVAGLCAAKLGARVTMTDLPPLDLLERNVRENQLIASCKVLDWSWAECGDERLDRLMNELPGVDFIIGCDILYGKDWVPKVLHTINALAHEHTEVLLTFTDRAAAKDGQDLEAFMCTARDMGFSGRQVDSSAHDPMFTDPLISILRLKRTHVS